VVLAKDPHRGCVTASDFFFADEQLSIVTCDEEGAVRLYEYDPESECPQSNFTFSRGLPSYSYLSFIPNKALSQTKDKSCSV
jgi:hypothetical protein